MVWIVGFYNNKQTYKDSKKNGKVYARALVVSPSSPYQRALACGACTGTAQIGVSLVSLFDPPFKRSTGLVVLIVRLT